MTTPDDPKPRTPLRFRLPDFTAVGTPGDDQPEEDSEGETTAVEGYADDNYVRRVIAKERPLPPV